MANNEHNVKIKIGGDSSSAVGAISRVKSALQGVRTVAATVSKALGWFHLAMNGINLLVDGFKKLKEWMGRAAEQAKALRRELENTAYETAIAHAAVAYDKLNKKIAENLKLEQHRNAILDKRKATARDLEDAELELSKQQEIAALDPMAADYDDRKKAIERKYASKASNVAAARAGEDTKAGADRLYADASKKDAEANDFERQYKRALAIENKAVERNWAATMQARRGNEDDVKYAEETEKQWHAAHDFAVKIKEQMEAARNEAKLLRERAGEMAGGNLAANIRNQAAQLAITTSARDEEAKKQKEAAEALQNEQEKSRQEREREATKALDEENRRKLDQASSLEAYADRMNAADGVSQNRLTAMGLGSGVAGNGDVAGDVRKIVDLLRQEVEATKNINTDGIATAAVFTE